MEILKSTNRARDFLPVFKAHQCNHIVPDAHWCNEEYG